MVHDTIRVDAPLRQVYDQWTQFEEFPRFMHGVEEVRQLDDRHLHWRTNIAGVKREFDTEIVDQLPDERIAWRTVEGDVRQKGVVTFERIDEDHTSVTLAMDLEPEGIAEKAGAALGVVDSRVAGDLLRFKNFVEDRREATGAWRGRLRPADAEEESGGTESREGAAGASPGAPSSREAPPEGMPGAGRPSDVPPEPPGFPPGPQPMPPR